MFNGGLSTLLAILLLVNSKSYVFITFFKVITSQRACSSILRWDKYEDEHILRWDKYVYTTRLKIRTKMR